MTNWIRVEGVDPWNAPQASLPASFQRAGPPVAVSRPSFSMIRGDCAPGSPAAMGMMGYEPGVDGLAECTAWSCELGWFTAGDLVDLQLTVPAIDPNGTPVAGYELLIDGAVVAGSPDLEPGTTGRVILDLQGADRRRTRRERTLSLRSGRPGHALELCPIGRTPHRSDRHGLDHQPDRRSVAVSGPGLGAHRRRRRGGDVERDLPHRRLDHRHHHRSRPANRRSRCRR